MALICDTGAIYALYDADDLHHSGAKAVIAAEAGPLLVPVVLLAEIDYLMMTRLGADSILDFLESIESSVFTLIAPSPEDLGRCRELIHQYRGFPLGLADAAVVATAERLGIQRVFTVDERHFRAIQPRGLNHFIILPADQG